MSTQNSPVGGGGPTTSVLATAASWCGPLLADRDHLCLRPRRSSQEHHPRLGLGRNLQLRCPGAQSDSHREALGDNVYFVTTELGKRWVGGVCGGCGGCFARRVRPAGRGARRLRSPSVPRTSGRVITPRRSNVGGRSGVDRALTHRPRSWTRFASVASRRGREQFTFTYDAAKRPVGSAISGAGIGNVHPGAGRAGRCHLRAYPRPRPHLHWLVGFRGERFRSYS